MDLVPWSYRSSLYGYWINYNFLPKIYLCEFHSENLFKLKYKLIRILYLVYKKIYLKIPSVSFIQLVKQ